MSAAPELQAYARRWRRREWAARIVESLAVVVPAALVLTASWLRGTDTSRALVLPLAVAATLLSAPAAWRAWRRRETAGVSEAARRLDRALPALENSSELLLVEAGSLPLVQRLQRARIEARLEEVESARPSTSRLRDAAKRLLLSTGAALVVGAVVVGWRGEVSVTAGEGVSGGGIGPLRIVRVAATISPPAYTGLPAETVEGVDVEALAGSTLRWRVEAPDAARASVLLDEREPIALQRLEAGVFGVEMRVDESRLLRFVVEDGDRTVRSPFGRLIARPDDPPEVRVVEPPPFLELAADDLGALRVGAEILDDYGAESAQLVATVASGYGELVEFRERRFDFPRREALEGGRRLRVGRSLDLEELGVRPGVELFFFVEATDRRRPRPNRARSVTHIVRIPGGSGQSVGLSARLPILRVPEFFRSQRQIILDTEKLLAEEGTLTAEEFRRRSEMLGFDQRALRLRYGGLLGEEFESGAPAGFEDDEEHELEDRRLEEIEAGDDAATEALESLGPGIVHQHDSEEVATYFDDEVKRQLRQALAEMWGAEGRLRSIDPRRALPFEYRALRWLKEVQQRSRLYVQKLGFEPPPLFPDDQRLTGELDGIRTVRRERRPEATESSAEVEAIRRLTDAIARWRRDGELGDDADEVVAAALALFAGRARVDEQFDLAALAALRRWFERAGEGLPVAAATVLTIERAAWSLLPEPASAPRPAGEPSDPLHDAYLDRLAGAPR